MYSSTMTNRLPVLAAALISLPLLLLAGCSTADPPENGNYPYFGTDDSGKRFVPQELQEKEAD
ncbi:MAG: hypothetical protein ACI8XO_003135 [Verrucomicrobiales bacterium]|jgi:hypothetical protein